MGKQINMGISDVARKCKKAWVGIDGVARKVKKGWIGDANGIARLFYSGDIGYFGMAPNLTSQTQNAYYMHRATFNDYGFVGKNTTLDIYSPTLTKQVISNVVLGAEDEDNHRTGDAPVKNKYLIIGNAKYATKWSSISASFTLSTLTGAYQASDIAVSLGDYALFGGGCFSNDTDFEVYGNVIAFNESLTKTNLTSLSYNRRAMAAEKIGDYALFIGGGCNDGSSGVKYIDVYDKNLTKINTTIQLNYQRFDACAVALNNHIIVYGGNCNTYIQSAKAELINASLTVSILDATTVNFLYMIEGVVVGEYALFAMGFDDWNMDYTDEVVVYDATLTKRTDLGLKLCAKSYNGVGIRAGDYALFGGGRYESSDGTKGYRTTVEAFSI